MYAFAPDSSSLFEQETLLPDQHADLHRAAHRNGEHRLLYAVLEDAVRCWQMYQSATTTRGQRLFCEAATWFADQDDSAPFTFIAICQLFDLEPDYVRAGLRLWSERHRFVRHRIVPFRVRRVSGTRHTVTGRAPGSAQR
jgi:hypothetical protein